MVSLAIERAGENRACPSIVWEGSTLGELTSALICEKVQPRDRAPSNSNYSRTRWLAFQGGGQLLSDFGWPTLSGRNRLWRRADGRNGPGADGSTTGGRGATADVSADDNQRMVLTHPCHPHAARLLESRRSIRRVS